jgi:DNA modification methylase
MMSTTILVGDVRTRLLEIPTDSIHCIVTSPPYWGLRDYGVEGQIGLEASPAKFIAEMVAVFEELRRVLRPDGTCWVNMGDSYAGGRRGPDVGSGLEGSRDAQAQSRMAQVKMVESRRRDNAMIPRSDGQVAGLKPKDLVMMPHRLAIALQDAGWWVRQDIVWAKPNPMPESVRDRCTKSHEYIFLLTKSEHYYYDQNAIAEPCSPNTHARLSQNLQDQIGSTRANGGAKSNGPMKAVARGVGFGHGADSLERQRGRVTRVCADRIDAEASARMGRAPGWRKSAAALTGTKNNNSFDLALAIMPETRNKRSVWSMSTQSFKDAHFATFPTELPETCIKAGCPPGGTVLDPFFGAGTTGLVADRLQRNCIGIELNPAYAEMARKRIQAESTLFAEIEVAA